MRYTKNALQKITFLLFFLIFQSIKAQNTFFINGKINEKNTQENLIGANIAVLETKQFSTTNEFGQFTLKLKNGKYHIVASYVSYRSDTLLVDLQQDIQLDFSLLPISLSEVTVTGNKVNLKEKLGTMALPMAQIQAIPALLGEADILRALTLLPGVSNGTEGSVGLNVRGGSPEQNLILIDGATIYNASHVYGFFSAFNADAVKRVELVKGGFPARYGGRLSSVIDVTFKDGNKEKKNEEFGIGILNTQYFREGPLQKGKSSYMLAARGSFFDLVTFPQRLEYETGANNDFQNYRFYDLNFKTNYLIGKKGNLSVGFFNSSDYSIYYDKTGDEEVKNTLKWASTVGSVRYAQPLSKKLFYVSQLAYNRYRSGFFISLRPDTTKKNENLPIDTDSKTVINDLSFKNNFSLTINKNSNLAFGTELLGQFFLPNVTTTKIDGKLLEAFSSKNSKIRNSIGYAFFADYETTILKKITAKIGLRQSNYHVEKNSFHFLEPRVALSCDINNRNVVKVSFTRMNQMIHLLSNNLLGFTNNSWTPATPIAPPQSATQYALGYILDLPRWKSYFSIESYYKNMANLIDYSEGASPFIDNAQKGWESIIQKNGKGRAYGIEVLLHKETGRFNGLIEYTYSRTERQFEKINRGHWYPSAFDRRHDFGITSNYALSKKWNISKSIFFSTGAPYSGADYIYFNKFDNYKWPLLYYTSRNNIRLPNYHRMDIGFTYTNPNRYGRKWIRQWSFGAFNAYNKKNAIAIESTLKGQGYYNSTNTEYIFEKLKGAQTERTFLPIVPYITFNVKQNK